MTETQWAELRQVGLATLDHQAAVRAATDLLELGPGFGDPLLAAWHLADFTEGAELAFSSRTIRFVPATGGRTGIVAIDMHATDREHGTGLKGELCHTLTRFV